MINVTTGMAAAIANLKKFNKKVWLRCCQKKLNEENMSH